MSPTDRKGAIRNVNLADAKAHLDKLIEQAARGETVRITRRGKPPSQNTRSKRRASGSISQRSAR